MKYLSYICIQWLIVSYELHLFTEIWKNCTHNRVFESTWTHHHSKTRWEEPRSQKRWVIVTCIRPPLRPPESRVSRQEGVHMYNILHLCVSATSVTTATLLIYFAAVPETPLCVTKLSPWPFKQPRDEKSRPGESRGLSGEVSGSALGCALTS